jgi:hypothetical protein
MGAKTKAGAGGFFRVYFLVSATFNVGSFYYFLPESAGQKTIIPKFLKGFMMGL